MKCDRTINCFAIRMNSLYLYEESLFVYCLLFTISNFKAASAKFAILDLSDMTLGLNYKLSSESLSGISC